MQVVYKQICTYCLLAINLKGYDWFKLLEQYGAQYGSLYCETMCYTLVVKLLTTYVVRQSMVNVRHKL